MSELRPFALLRTGDQWLRCSFDRTYLDPEAGVVELAWKSATAESDQAAPATGAGLAFDRECRLYHSVVSDDGASDRVERILWKATDPLGPVADQPPALNLFGGERDETLGDFTTTDRARILKGPSGLAVDADDRLFIAERGADRVLVYDLWSERLVRRIALPGGQPSDLAAHGAHVYAVLDGTRQIVRLTASSGPDPWPMPAGCAIPSRIAISASGRVAILERAGTAAARVWFADPRDTGVAAAMATDVEWESDAVLVVARQPGADFLRYRLAPGQPPAQLASLRAREYDGRGITVMPSGDCECSGERRVGYWTAAGFRGAVLARLVYERVGRVTTCRLDSGVYQTVWGRLFVDACIPTGTSLRVHSIVADEADDEIPMDRLPPTNVGGVTVSYPELSPPMPPAALTPGSDAVTQPLHLRESGRELPWTQPLAGDRFDTYEAPINAATGRYLWITLELRGNTRVSPKVRCLRAEYPAHDYLRRLPKTFSRDTRAAAFLLRYLSMFEGFLGETEARAVERDLLLAPGSSPDGCLAWLASFVGLTLDDRWATAPGSSVDARRRIIREAAWLFRYRGTVPGLKRFIELYVGIPVVVLEHYRMRGVGDVALNPDPALSSAIVGMGFRIGGAIGTSETTAVGGSVEDAFATHAHRFTVMIPAALTGGQLDVVRSIVTVHRPAHTVFDVCTAGAGMRVGRALLLEISSVIGATGAFPPFQIGGSSALGRGAVIGLPPSGGSIGNSRVGSDTRIG